MTMVNETKVNTELEKWLCMSCHFLLGYVERKNVLRIKRKDLYIEITGGDVVINCPRCGKVNHLHDDKTSGVVPLQEKP